MRVVVQRDAAHRELLHAGEAKLEAWHVLVVVPNASGFKVRQRVLKRSQIGVRPDPRWHQVADGEVVQDLNFAVLESVRAEFADGPADLLPEVDQHHRSAGIR